MSTPHLDDILKAVQNGELAPDAAKAQLEAMQAEPLGFATIDHARKDRCGAGEVIYGEGKTPSDLVRIAESIYERQGHVLITRCDAEKIAALRETFKDAPLEVAERGGAVLVGVCAPVTDRAIPVIAAGTSDLAIAEEAVLTCKALGHPAKPINDVGVAGLHRLLGRMDDLKDARVVIVIAGMEGALPSVVGGLVDVPVIAVPTSVGYGASFGGLAALLGMLNSCASGVVTCNIDNGFGAAYTACMINRGKA